MTSKYMEKDVIYADAERATYLALNARESRRLASEHRYLLRMEKREAAAQKMIGSLMRGGKEVYYVFPIGGRYREGTEGDLVAFLIKNGYA